MRICPSCGEENPERFRLCGFCGAPLAPQAPAQEVRKTVTVVFSDLKGSTAMAEKLDSEAVREVLDVYFSAMRRVLERHGGLVEKYIGDAIMAVFGLPRLHEDDALRAIRAAHEMQAELARVNERLQARWGVRLENRTGVNTGEVVAGDPTTGQRLVTGDTVNVAARLEQAAPALQVLLGGPTYRLVRDAVEVEEVEPLELKGKSERVPAYRLLGVQRGEGVARRADTPLVGRAGELAAMTNALQRASKRRTPELVTLLAAAGVGKSRLLHEFLSGAAGQARVLRGRCLSYGEGITFWPLAEMARDAARITDHESAESALARLRELLGGGAADVVDRLAAMMGLSDATYPVQETFWAARRLLEIVAETTPTIAVIEDIHWAEATFLDLIEYVAQSSEGAPLLLLCSSRPELLELRPAWGEPRSRSLMLTLRPLTAAESATVVSNLLGEGALADEPRHRIVEAAQGNPLFVEQMLSMMIDDGMIRRSAEGWVASSDIRSLTVPPSISALLAARLDRLAPTERVVLERAAVIGHTFDLEAVENLCPEGLRVEVRTALEGLAGRDLVTPDEPDPARPAGYRFQHILIRDAAYQGLLKRTRAELHRKFADWLEAHDLSPLGEQDEIRGYHLEQSCLILSQLGPLDQSGIEAAGRAARHLSAAGERARSRGDVPAAANLLQRAAALVPEEPASPRWLLHAGEALGEMGQFQSADEVLTAAQARSRELGDPALAVTASVVRRTWRYLTDPLSSEASGVVAATREAITALEQLDAAEGLARAWKLMMYAHFYEGRFSPAEDCVTRAVLQADRAGDRVYQVRLLSALASCVVYSRTPVDRALERCRDIIELAGGDRRTEAMTLSAMSHLEAMSGEPARARELYQRSRAMLNELGFTLSAACTSLHSGPAELLGGDAVRAEAELRGDYERLVAMGEGMYAPSVAGLLAEALHAQGRNQDAAEFAGICRRTAAPHDVGGQYQWRCIEAKLLVADAARRDEAEELAREAVRLIKTTDQPDVQGEALAGLAEVLAAAGKPTEAAASLREAISLFDAKGNAVSAGRARLALRGLSGSAALKGRGRRAGRSSASSPTATAVGAEDG